MSDGWAFIVICSILALIAAWARIRRLERAVTGLEDWARGVEASRQLPQSD